MVLQGCPTPRGYLSVSTVAPEEHGTEGLVPRPPGGPLVGPAQPPVHLPHQGESLLPQRVRDRAPVLVPWPAPLCPPRRPPSLPLCLRPQDRSQVASRFTRTHASVYIVSCVGFMSRCVLEGGIHMHVFMACTQTNPAKPQEPRQRHEG